MSRPAQCILVVENDPDLLRAVTLRLRVAGYRVMPAATIAAARAALQDAIVHMAIIDIRATDDRSESDTSGFAFARTLPSYMPCLFHTAHETKENIRLALGEIGADDIIDKEDPAAPAKLLARIGAMFAESVGINFGLTLTSTVDLALLAAAVAPALPTDAPRPSGDDIDLLVRRLLPQALTVTLTPLLPPETAQSYSSSGAVLLRVHETRTEGAPAPMVLKIGPTALITDEADRYETIRPFLGAQRLARLEGVAHSRQVGGLLYTLVNAQDWTALNSLLHHLHREDTGSVQQLLRRFLQQTFTQLQQTTQPATLDLTSDYTTKLNLTVPKLRNAIQQWRPALLTASVLPGVASTTPLGNPVTWAIQDERFRTRDAIESYTVLCHGDLHSRNVLVDNEGACWLIDFGRAGRSHLLRDFVELETDLRLQLAPGQPVAAQLVFERALLPGAHGSVAALPDPLRRAHALIETVRATADELTVGRLRWAEYGEALFWHLLNALRLRGLTTAQKESALLAAAVWADWLDTAKGQC